MPINPSLQVSNQLLRVPECKGHVMPGRQCSTIFCLQRWFCPVFHNGPQPPWGVIWMFYLGLSIYQSLIFIHAISLFWSLWLSPTQSRGAFSWASSSTRDASHGIHYIPSLAGVTHLHHHRPLPRVPISPVACLWLEKRADTTSTPQGVSGLEHLSYLQSPSTDHRTPGSGKGIIQLAAKSPTKWPSKIFKKFGGRGEVSRSSKYG